MPDKGMVILVGAGPGDPGLLTLAGKAAMESADVILFDRLVGDGVLAMLPDSAVKIDVGKNKGNHPVPQGEINRLIIEHARAGKRVVRLKGGDPYLFGRGAEELEAVAGEGIPFRVVPGITSAVAVPAYAGIPVTHRDHASSLHILTGHGREGGAPDIPYDELAKLKGTLVFLMGLSALEEICRGLAHAGMAPETPAALVENGARRNQRVLSGTLESLPRLAIEQAAASPSLLVIGRVCELAGRLDWMAGLPLRGKRVLVASSSTTGGRLAHRLRENGCAVDEFAGVGTERIPAPASFWNAIGRYDWIVLTSQFGAECFFDSLFEAGGDIRAIAGARFAVVGSRTGRALSRRGIRPDFTPAEFSGRALGAGLARLVKPGDRVLLFRAEAGGGDVPDILRSIDAMFDDVAAYRTLKRAPAPALLEAFRDGAYDALTFTSASAVEAFAPVLSEGAAPPPAFCIGEMTAAAARNRGMRVEVAKEATIESLADAVLEKLGNP